MEETNNHVRESEEKNDNFFKIVTILNSILLIILSLLNIQWYLILVN